jgi:hypothetical protein
MQAEHPLHHLDASERTDRRRSKRSQTDVSFHDQQSVASVPCGQFRRTEAVDNAQVRLVRERVADDPPPRGTNGDEAVSKSAPETAKAFQSALVGEHDERRVASIVGTQRLAYSARETTALRCPAASSDDSLTAEDRRQPIESLVPETRIIRLIATSGIGRAAS